MTKLRTIQILRGTTAQNNAYTGVIGELTMDTTTNEVRIHDGSTQGGVIIGSNRANTDLSNLTSIGKNIANWSSNVSNCVTEIPQDINLTLSNGTLTLKAGSKVYVPNGAGVFDVRNITTDQTYTQTTNGQYLLLARQDMSIWGSLTSAVTSGTTPPSGTGTFYNTTTNSIDWYSSGTYNERHYSFPFALITVSNGAISSIDQVFNGFGYIGSSVFVLPGVKGLAPNGWNADGTLKNQVCSNSVVRVTNNLTSTRGYTCGIGTSGTIITFFDPKVYVQEDYPYGPDYQCWYRPSENKIYNTQTSAGAQTQSTCAVSFYIKTSGGKIASLTPKTAFHAVDYNDLSTVALSGAYNDLIGKPTDLFDVKWSDHLLDNTSWLRADNFSWNSGVTYSVAYNHLVADIAGKTLQSETISGTTVQFYLANDGHKICPASEESNVAAIYAATGVAWYYIIDSANTRFKLPRTKFGFTGIRSGVGNYVAPALPNHTHDVAYRDVGTTGGQFNGVGGGSYFGDRTVTSGGASDSTYQNGATVQPPATQMYLYSYVGTFTQTALENTAGLNASLFNGKADVNLLNTASNVDFVIESQEPTAENDYTWYRKYKSGWVEQGGISVAIGDYETATITLPVAMSNIKYALTFGNGWNGTNDDGAYIGAYCERLPNRTTTSFQLYGRGATQREISFVVSGKAA